MWLMSLLYGFEKLVSWSSDVSRSSMAEVIQLYVTYQVTYRVRLHLVSNFFEQCLVHSLHVLAAGRTCETRCL